MGAAIALPLAIGLGATSVGASFLGADANSRAQKRSARRQADAQRLAAARAAADTRRAEGDRRLANQRQPDVTSILAREQRQSGLGGTVLTGTAGVDNAQLTLGASSFLGS